LVVEVRKVIQDFFGLVIQVVAVGGREGRLKSLLGERVKTGEEGVVESGLI